MRAIGLIAATIVFTGPVFAQGFGGGVTATTPDSGINSMAMTPSLPPSLTTNDGGRSNATSTSQGETSPGSTPDDVVLKEPGESPPVTSGNSRRHDAISKRKR